MIENIDILLEAPEDEEFDVEEVASQAGLHAVETTLSALGLTKVRESDYEATSIMGNLKARTYASSWVGAPFELIQIKPRPVKPLALPLKVAVWTTPEWRSSHVRIELENPLNQWHHTMWQRDMQDYNDPSIVAAKVRSVIPQMYQRLKGVKVTPINIRQKVRAALAFIRFGR